MVMINVPCKTLPRGCVAPATSSWNLLTPSYLPPKKTGQYIAISGHMFIQILPRSLVKSSMLIHPRGYTQPPLVTQLNTTSTIFPLYSTLFLCFSETLLKKNMGGRSWLMLRKCRRRNSYFAFLNVHKFSYCYLVFFFAIISN